MNARVYQEILWYRVLATDYGVEHGHIKGGGSKTCLCWMDL